MGSGNSKTLIQSYRDLHVWQDGMKLATACYRLTQDFPREERYGITSQTRRSSGSIPANIAEGNGRENRGEYIQFLRIAQGSLKELETHLLLSVQVGIVSETDIEPILLDCERQGKQIRALIRSLQAKNTDPA